MKRAYVALIIAGSLCPPGPTFHSPDAYSKAEKKRKGGKKRKKGKPV